MSELLIELHTVNSITLSNLIFSPQLSEWPGQDIAGHLHPNTAGRTEDPRQNHGHRRDSLHLQGSALQVSITSKTLVRYCRYCTSSSGDGHKPDVQLALSFVWGFLKQVRYKSVVKNGMFTMKHQLSWSVAEKKKNTQQITAAIWLKPRLRTLPLSVRAPSFFLITSSRQCKQEVHSPRLCPYLVVKKCGFVKVDHFPWSVPAVLETVVYMGT